MVSLYHFEVIIFSSQRWAKTHIFEEVKKPVAKVSRFTKYQIDWFYQQNPCNPCFTGKNIWRYLNFVLLEELHAIDCTTCLSYIWILLWARFRCFLLILNSASILHYKIKLKLIRRHSVKPIIFSTGKNCGLVSCWHCVLNFQDFFPLNYSLNYFSNL